MPPLWHTNPHGAFVRRRSQRLRNQPLAVEADGICFYRVVSRDMYGTGELPRSPTTSLHSRPRRTTTNKEHIDLIKNDDIVDDIYSSLLRHAVRLGRYVIHVITVTSIMIFTCIGYNC